MSKKKSHFLLKHFVIHSYLLGFITIIKYFWWIFLLGFILFLTERIPWVFPKYKRMGKRKPEADKTKQKTKQNKKYFLYHLFAYMLHTSHNSQHRKSFFFKTDYFLQIYFRNYVWWRRFPVLSCIFNILYRM